jgi:hypothetical protein
MLQFLRKALSSSQRNCALEMNHEGTMRDHTGSNDSPRTGRGRAEETQACESAAGVAGAVRAESIVLTSRRTRKPELYKFHPTSAKCITPGGYIDLEILREAIVSCKTCGDATILWYHDWNDFAALWDSWSTRHRELWKAIRI